MSGWATPHAQWRAWLDEGVLAVAPVVVIDEFDRELRGVLEGLFGVTLEVTSVGSPARDVHEDSMTTLVRHREDVSRAEPPEEFDAASTLVHAPKLDDDHSGFDVALQTPGGGLQVELDAQAQPEDAGFYIPALTESAKIVVGAPTGPRIETPDANPTVGVPELVTSESVGVPTPLTAPTMGAAAEAVVRVESMSAATARDSGPIAWTPPDPTPVPDPGGPAPHVVPVGDAAPVRTGTTLIPTEAPANREPVASSSQTAGVIVSLLDDDDGPPQPPRRSSKIVVASESTSAGIVADVYDDSGEYPRPVPNEPLDETELEDDDLDAELDSAEIEAPAARPRPPAPKPAVKLVTNEQPPPPPRAEAKPEPRVEAKEPRVEPKAEPPPPPAAKAEAKHEGPPPPPAKAEPRHEGPPPPPPARAPEPSEPPAETRRPEPARPVEEMAPRVRTLPGIAGPHWSDEVFTEHFFALVRPGEARIAATECEYLLQALGLAPGAAVIDVGCGDGWHAQLLAERGMRVVGLDVSQAMIQRAKELADQHGVRVRWVLGDVRQRPLEEQFDAVLSLGTSFGYDDDVTNRRTLAALRDLVRVGGRLVLHVVNRDYVVPRLPARSWWQGEHCLVLDEVDMQDWTSRVRVRRTIVFEDGQQFEHTLSIRVYALHELVELAEGQGLRVVEVSGSPHTRGRFYGATSPDIWVIAERVDDR